jgi:hypothetical protein
MNPKTRRVALYAIAAIAIVASANALAHSYAGLYAWAVHHRLTGWQAMSWPAEIDVFLAIGELALYVAYLDGWPARQRIWPWVTTLAGLAVSVAGNVGHIEPLPGHPVLLSDRLTAAASPLAAFAGLTVGLLVLRMNRLQNTALASVGTARYDFSSAAMLDRVDGHYAGAAPWVAGAAPVASAAACAHATSPTGVEDSVLMKDAAFIYRTAAARGEQLSQRALARTLRGQGHRFPNDSLRSIAMAVGLGTPPGHLPATDG